MKTPLRFLKKAALAAALPALVSTAAAATSNVQPRLTWFNEAVSEYQALPAWASDCTLDSENGFIEIDGDVTYNPADSTENEVAYVDLTLKFASIPADLPDLPDNNAQTAITAADDSGTAKYYVYGKADASSAAAWLPVDPQDAAPVADATVTVTITVDYTAGTATYVIGGVNAKTVTLAATLGDNQKHVSTLTFSGDGCLGDFFGTQGVATHTLGGANVSYASNAAALAAAIAEGKALETWSGNANDGWTTTSAGSGTSAAPFLIRTVDDLNDLATIVQSTNCTGIVFQQANDIDFDGAAAFAGIGTYNVSPTGGKPFCGTYDGQNYKIANVTFTDRDYCGIFNQVVGSGTIENLTAENLSFVGSGTKYCASIVGYAANGATLRNLTAAGTFGSQAKPGKHNMAGIVIRANGGATAQTITTIASCTNNATLYGGYSKIGGICAITQTQSGFANGTVAFTDCANNGSVIKVADSTDTNGGFGGILAYATDKNTELTGCVNNGTVTTDSGASFHVGQIVGHMQANTLKDNGGNSASANAKMVGHIVGGTVTGFQYAKVDNGVATTIAPPYTLVKDTTYLLEGDATPSFTLAAAGDTIAFDTALGYTLTDTGIAAAEGLLLNKTEPTAPDTVTTFTAAAPPVRAVFLR